jgi:putative isomerase
MSATGVTPIPVSLAKLPASIYGSYWSLCPDAATNALELRTLHGSYGWDNNAVLTMSCDSHCDFSTLDLDTQQNRFSCDADDWTIDARFPSADVLEIMVTGSFVELCYYGRNTEHLGFKHGMGWWVGKDAFNVLYMGIQLQLRLAWEGCSARYDHETRTLRLDPVDARPVRVILESSRTELPTQYRAGDRPEVPVRSFDEWLAAFGEFPAGYRDACVNAAYNLWSATIPPGGELKRPAVLMTTRVMHYVWSWDHCFNAIALAPAHPDLAWDQLQVMFDAQYESGRLPDFIADHGRTEGLQKVPIHGWALLRLMESGAANAREMRQTYDRISAWTRWWFRDRDDDRDGICQFNHGNECQDNATIFDLGCPVISPDLSAYLALQCSVLARIADGLALHDEGNSWRELSAVTVSRMIGKFWKDDHFEMYHLPSGRRVGEHGLVQFMPLVLGDLLPEAVFRRLLDRLMGDSGFFTPHGLATESTRSPHYGSVPKFWKGSVYWRGPIWAPLVHLIVDGMRRAGATAEAARIAKRFVDTVARSGGFYENYDAQTGEGRDDLGYTWTASVFLALIRDFNLDRTER